MENVEKPLLIYSASAGSGKTYTLVKSYLRLILLDDVSVNQFSKIMAMTFTNKAALEMKSRIIKALDDLSKPDRSTKGEKEQADAHKYLSDIAKDFDLSEKQVIARAQAALTGILHQYEDFSVMTIDKFNLRLIRSFASDLNMDVNFKVVINEEEVNQRVIDDILNDVDKSFTSIYAKVFYDLASDRIEDGKGWNFERDLFNYANILKYEKNLALINQFNLEDIRNSKTEIYERLSNIKMGMNQLISKLKNDVIPYRDQLPFSSRSNAPFLKRLDNLDANSFAACSSLFTDAMARALNDSLMEGEAASVFYDFYPRFFVLLEEWEETDKIRQSYYYIVLLKMMQERLQNFRNEEQIVRISEFNQMISELLAKENSLFIYEKLGTRFEHYLLDEFQDTSRLQWLNIIPLIHESLGHRYFNLIVGDPKQSIYRFRGGLAEQFVELPKIYNPENDPELANLSNYFDEMGFKDNLGTNFRSSKDIVEFNNLFFSSLVDYLKNSINQDYQSFYKDVKQEIHNQQCGFVQVVSIFEKGRGKIEEEDENEVSELDIDFMLDSVRQCLEDGYEKGDICILGSLSSMCNKYALALTQKGYSVVSSDSLAVDSDQLVKLSLLYLRWRNQPSSLLIAKLFIEKYLWIKNEENSISTYFHYMKETVENNQKIRRFEVRKFVEDYFESWENFFSSFENIYSLLEKFYQNAGFNELNSPYLHHLSDLAFEFDLNNGPDLMAFIDYYSTNGKTSSIQTPDNKEAIKIMTAHKSKGLEFKVVIIPQIGDNFLKSKNKYLLKMNKGLAYTNLKKAPVSENLLQYYNEEFSISLLDKLNLYYVAFTRAVDRLYVMNRIKGNSDANFGTYFHEFLKSSSPFTSRIPIAVVSSKRDGKTLTHEQLSLSFGEKRKLLISNNTTSENGFIPTNIGDRLWFPSISLKRKLIEMDANISSQIRYGKQLHELLSEVEKFENEAVAINYFLRKGKIERGFVKELKSDLSRIIQNPTYQDLFANVREIINEQTIIVSEEEIKRPDKIIVKERETIVLDFKTGIEENKYIKQVKQYQQLLTEVGFENVKGVIIYTGPMKFVWVE